MLCLCTWPIHLLCFYLHVPVVGYSKMCSAMQSKMVTLLPSARMRSEGTVVGSVCLCVTQHLTSPMFVRLTNDTTYLTGNEGQKFRAVLSENAPLQS